MDHDANGQRDATAAAGRGLWRWLGTADEFEWESPLQAARYRVTLRDSKDVLIFTGETSGSPFRPDAALKSQLRTGETYTWKVESLDASGSVIAQSVPVTFRYS